jgi:iron complex outermembrane receptor protein
MHSIILRSFSALLACCCALDLAAQSFEEEDLALTYGDKSTVSLATGSQQAVSRAPAVATVITAQDIKAMGASDLDQVLESVPGLHVSKSHIASKPIYSFRGIHTLQNSQVLMLVNGIPITNVFQGDRGQIWGGMPLENVARIEVIRGPGSALYGADAFSGVINVITRTAADIKGTETGVRAGSFNTKDAWIQHGGTLGALDAAFYLRAGNTDGQKEIIRQDAAGNSGPINEERKAVDARADLSKEAWRFRSAYQYRKLGAGGGIAGSLDPNSRTVEKRLYLDLSYDQANWAENWDVSGVVGYYDIKQIPVEPYLLFPAGTPGFPNGMLGGPSHSERHTYASVSTFYTGFEQHRIRLGAGMREDDLYETSETKNFNATFAPICDPLNPTDPAPAPCTPVLMNADARFIYLLPHKRELTYAFVQDEWNLAQDWALTAGVRHDNYSDFGGTTNPRLALVWDADYNVVVKLMHGTAFRAPSFVEQYAINNPVQSGTPNIKPETIKTDELAFNWQATGDLQTSLNFFRYRMRDIIQQVGTTMQNAGDQSGRGLELEATLDASDNLRLSGSYSLQHSYDTATGQDAGLAPHRRAFVRADWRFAPLWHLDTNANHVADRKREQGDARAPVADYTLVHLSLRREKLAGDWEVNGMIYNLFDRKAYEPSFKLNPLMQSDLPLPGRSLYLQLQLKL